MKPVICLLLFITSQATVIPEKYLKYLRNISYYAEDYRRNCLGYGEFTESRSSEEAEVPWTLPELEYIENLALSLIDNDNSNKIHVDNVHEENENYKNSQITADKDLEDEEESNENIRVRSSEERKSKSETHEDTDEEIDNIKKVIKQLEGNKDTSDEDIDSDEIEMENISDERKYTKLLDSEEKTEKRKKTYKESEEEREHDRSDKSS